MKVSDIISFLEEIAPPRLASEGDKIGLQVGDPNAEVNRVVVSVDATSAVVEKAIELGADMLVTHHPLIFNPLEKVAMGDPIAERIMKLITSGTALYVMHTNYDSAPGGVNDILADRLGIKNTKLLAPKRRERKFKVAVFTPKEALDKVRDAMADAGAGVIDDYSHCSFGTLGTGTFLPLEGADPYIGKVGKLEEAEEYRLEMIVPEWWLSAVLDAMVQAHPYEEVAYDVYALENAADLYGYGRVGTLEKPMPLRDFRKRVEESLNFRETRMIGDENKLITTVAVCSGSGRSLIPDAIKARADVYVCGDVRYPDFLEADSYGLAVIDAGHYETERPGMEVLFERLSRKYAEDPVSIDFCP